MHRLFYHNFHVTSMQDWMVALLGSFTVGACIGCLTCMKMPVTGLYEVCGGVLSGQASISSQILCALCGFLFSFSVCAFVHTLHTAGWVFAGLLLAGRGICLIFLFWFLLRRFQVGGRSLSQDLAVACCFSGATILVFHWLLSPVVAELSQSFILT